MKRRLLYTIAFALAVASCTKDETTLERRDSVKDDDTVETAVCQVIVKADDELAALLEQASAEDKLFTRSMAMNNAVDELGIVSFERLFPYAGEFEGRTRREGLHKYYIINYDPSVSAVKAVSGLKAVSGAVSVEVPRRVKRLSLPDDPYFKWQWDLYNDGKMNLDVRYDGSLVSSNKGCDINVGEVWESYTTGSRNVVVAVVDGGVDLNHPDLEGVCIPAGSGGSWDFVKNSSTLYPDSHGTHVAGTIAAVRNNGVGVAGIAGGDHAMGVSGVRILSCQIFNEKGGASDAATMRALKYGADHGAVISQNSWGHDYDTDGDGEISSSELRSAASDKLNSYEKDGIDYFVKYAGCDDSGNQLADSPMKGGVVVFAAGNDGIQYGAPADYEPVVAVGAVGADWQRTWYSNYGDWVDICAPGGDGYGSDSASNYDSAGYSRGNIYNLYSTRKDSDYDYTNYGYMLGTSMACPHVSGVLALVVSYFGGTGFTNEEAKRLLLDGANTSYLNSRYPVGPVLDAMGCFKNAVPSTVAPDPVVIGGAEVVSRKATLEFAIPSDADDGSPKGILIAAGTDRSVIAGLDPASIPAGVKVYNVDAGSGSAGKNVSYTISGLDYGTTYYLVMYAYDRSKNYSAISEVITLVIPENHAPVIRKEFEPMIIYKTGVTILRTLDDYFSDPDQDQLTYRVEYGNNVVSPSLNGNLLKLKSVLFGTGDVSVIATDEGGKSVRAGIKVIVKDPAAPVDTYPELVESELVISTEEAAQTHVRITGSTGKTVYEGTSTFSGFDPLVVDMGACAPGRYGLSVSYGGKTYKKIVVKI